MDQIGKVAKKGARLQVDLSEPTRKGGIYTYELDLSQFGITCDGSLLETSFRAFVTTAKSKSSLTIALAWQNALPHLNETDQRYIRQILGATDAGQLTRQSVVTFFGKLQAAIEAAYEGRAVMTSIRRLRNFFAAGLDTLFKKGVIPFRYHDIEGYLPSIPAAGSSREGETTTDPRTQILSNHEHPGSSSPEAIQHKEFGDSIDDAYQEIETHLDNRLKDLRLRCFKAVDAWHERKERLVAMADAMTIPRYLEIKEKIARVRKMHRVHQANLKRTKLDKFITVEELAVYYIKEFLIEEFYRYEKYNAVRDWLTYPRGEKCSAPLVGYEKGNMLTILLNSLAYYDAETLTALQAIILSECAFNPGPLSRLHQTQALRQKMAVAQWVLKPFKDKTETPQEGILVKHVFKPGEESFRTGFDAMDLAWANFQNLTRDWAFATGHEGKIFCNIFHQFEYRASQVMYPSKHFNVIKQQYGLPEGYLLEKIRHQVGSTVAVKNKGDIRATQAKLNHADISTAFGYTANVMGILDDMVIRKFERQLEATLLFGIGGEKQIYALGLDPKSVNPRLIPIVDIRGNQVVLPDLDKQLVAVGNGVGCANITDSPNHTIPQGELCDRSQCHDCRNARYIITEGRMRENVRWLHYYRENLHKIQSRNPEHWQQVGILHYAFQIAMASVLSEHPTYGGLYRQIQAELNQAGTQQGS